MINGHGMGGFSVAFGGMDEITAKKIFDSQWMA